MLEVSEFFAGNRNWNGEHKDDDLAEYFQRISNTIEDFEYRDIQKLMQALEDL